MRFYRIDDDVVVGVGGEHFFRKGETYDITDLDLINQFMADPSWQEVDALVAPADDDPAGDGEPPGGEGVGVASGGPAAD